MKKIILYIFLGLVLLTIGGYFYANYLVKSKLESFLAEQLSPELDFTYGDLDMTAITGAIAISDIKIKLSNQMDTLVHTRATVDKLSLSGFGYWKYFVQDQIQFEKIEIDKNNITYFKDKFKSASKSDTIKQNPLATLQKTVLIKAIDIGKTSFTIYDSARDSVVLRVAKAAFSARDVRTDDSTIRKRIPLTYGDIHLVSDSVFLRISPRDVMTVGHIELSNKDITIQDLTIKPKYSKEEYTRQISREHDYTDLVVPVVNVMGYDFGFSNSKLFTTVDKIQLDAPVLGVYRDKRVADDPTFKPLYSKMLRDLSMDLMVDSILVENSSITYEEKLKSDQPAGSIKFTDLDLTMSTVGNTQPKGELTKITANGLFQQSKLHVDWSFDVHNTNDAFRFSGNIGRMPAANINSFTQPNLNIGFTGTLEEIYFDISGNNNTSQTSMKMAYDDFKIDVMRKDGKGINKFLSGIANIFIPKDSEKNGDRYREGKGEAERNKTQSVFNFVWVSILSALIKTMT
ncbi:hypothetical protein SAMN05192588_2225 [Nonlabens sp. Hel1_33_55]|uniref:hypothetical protein n=1 Tax=Nonlabens sp. Hel1_33_55 TaxID=1336802 RepID=UPI000875BD12|nr:hypothetical protein [Nonlabens sp. Hel1_33_55]SCY31831.1 hypothetical protein SAMN05192588_2225 [Nonlabens sp. Hel1_33_55]